MSRPPKIETIGPGESEQGPKKQADALLALCRTLDLHHDADNAAYATWHYQRARQTHRLRSTAFKSWLCWRAYSEQGLTPSANAVAEALAVLEGRAIHDGKLIPVFRRVAEHEGKIYLDLANEHWTVIEVDADGWREVSDPPVRFTRGTGMLSLPRPVNGDVTALARFLNLEHADDFNVLIGWLIGALQPRGPYPILALSGRQGSAKSTAARLLISLIDPNKAPLRSAPKSEDDLLVAVQHSRVVCFDNVSNLSPELSDAVCRLATGGGTAKRMLYSDAEAVVLDAQAPVVMTGIGAYLTRGDAADRSLPVALRPLRDGEYRPERELLADFDAARPGILGGLLDGLATSIRRRGEVRGTSRLADFDAAVEAAGPAFGWAPGYFNGLLANLRTRARRDHIAEDDLAQNLLEAAPFDGTCTELRALLALKTGASWWLPKNARALGSAIDRLAPLLESVGLLVGRTRSGGKKGIRLWRDDGKGHDGHKGHEPASSSPPEPCPEGVPIADDSSDGHAKGHRPEPLDGAALDRRAHRAQTEAAFAACGTWKDSRGFDL